MKIEIRVVVSGESSGQKEEVIVKFILNKCLWPKWIHKLQLDLSLLLLAG